MSNNQRNLDEYSAITNILSLFLSFIYPFGSSFILFLVAALIKEKEAWVVLDSAGEWEETTRRE